MTPHWLLKLRKTDEQWVDQTRRFHRFRPWLGGALIALGLVLFLGAWGLDWQMRQSWELFEVPTEHSEQEAAETSTGNTETTPVAFYTGYFFGTIIGFACANGAGLIAFGIALLDRRSSRLLLTYYDRLYELGQLPQAGPAEPRNAPSPRPPAE